MQKVSKNNTLNEINSMESTFNQTSLKNFMQNTSNFYEGNSFLS